jgi:hypothetical protein
MKLFTAIVVLGLTAIVWMNSCVDVAGLDTYDRVASLTRAQGPDDLLEWEQLFDQRAWLKTKLSIDCPEVLILGSSTVGALRQDMFASHRILNGWLSAPTVEDLEALTVVLDRAGCRPKAIVLGVDPWLLNAAFGDQRWMSLFDDYTAYQPGMARMRGEWLALRRRWSHFKERLNYSTTKLTLQTLYRRVRGDAAPSEPRLVHASPDELCATIKTPHYIRANDGHYVSCKQFVPSVEDVAAVANNYVLANTHEIRTWREVDPVRMSRVRAALATWHERGSAVIVLGPPYHPQTWAALRADPTISSTLDALDRALASLEGVRYVRLRDPSSVGCTASEFEDGHHGQPTCARKVAARLEEELSP